MWTDIERSDLFGWFGFHEVGREALPNGNVRVELKPGGHQDAIDFAVELEGERLRSATLTMDRAWMDSGEMAPFADDLAKSVLYVLTPENALISDLANRIAHFQRGSAPLIIGPGWTSGPDTPPSPPLLLAIEAYLGRLEDAVLVDSGDTLTLRTGSEDGRPRLHIRVDCAQAPPGADPGDDRPGDDAVPEPRRTPWWRRLFS